MGDINIMISLADSNATRGESSGETPLEIEFTVNHEQLGS